MHITSAISVANQSCAIYFLLTSYVDAVALQPAPHPCPDWALQLPLRCRNDVAAALVALIYGSRWTNIEPSTPEQVKTAEALAVFRVALNRIDLLENTSGTRAGLKELCLS